jgi:hypothetical protein
LVEQKEGGNGASTELESFGEEEEEEEGEDDGEDAEGDINGVQFEGRGEESLLLEECKETRVVDKKGGGQLLEERQVFKPQITNCLPF